MILNLKITKLNLIMDCKIIFYSDGSQNTFADKLPLEQALPLALNLHRASNVPHTIDVIDGVRQVCTLLSQKDS